jgi:phosphotransferase system HPr-like phosphotransfer protein
MAKRPEIRKREGHTIVAVVVKLDQGIGLKESHKLVEEVGTHNRNSYLEFAKNKLSLNGLFGMPFMIDKGDQLRIWVKGEDKDARKYALRLYSALTSPSFEKMRFDKGMAY